MTFPSNIEVLLEKADIIEQASALVMYLGFCVRQTTVTSTASWAICKIEKDSATVPYIQTVKWVNGSRMKIFIWDSRAGYTYQFRT